MRSYKINIVAFLLLIQMFYSCTNETEQWINMDNFYPWCVVAFDSLNRSPEERINMIKELGFYKYAYDWEVDNLDNMYEELKLAEENNLEVVSVWFWLNAKRDSVGKLSPRNERALEILKKSELKTTLWVSFSNNFFKDLSHEKSMIIAKEMIQYIYKKAESIGCKIELYNHKGWFGNLNNQVAIIEALPQYRLKIVYNFHHGQQDIEEFSKLVKKITPHLASVNLNGMKIKGPKILPIGKGDYEKQMINQLLAEGFTGPWGILGHVKNEDVKLVLERNISGLKSLGINLN